MTTAIDSKFMKAIQEPIETALAEIAEKFEIQIKLGSGTYSEGVYGKFDLELSAISETGEIFTEEAAAYKLNAGHKGGDLEEFEPDWLFKKIEFAKATYKLMGFKTRASKFNMVIHCLRGPCYHHGANTGKRHVAPSTQVLRAFKEQYIDLDGWDLNRAAEENQVDIARALIARRDNIEARDDIGSTPLHAAARNNSLPVSRLLIDRGADIEAQNNEEETPLQVAAGNHFSGMALLLINKGANWEGIDLNWMDEQHRPKETPKEEVERVLWQQREAQKLKVDKLKEDNAQSRTTSAGDPSIGGFQELKPGDLRKNRRGY